MNKISKYIISFFYAAVISGLGYGVWTKIITPLFNWTFNNLFHFWSLFHSNFIDIIYKNALQEEVNLWYEDLRSLIIFILLISAYFFITKINQNWLSIHSNYNNRRPARKLNIIILINYSLLVIGAISLNLQVFLVSTEAKISTYAYKGIEIVRPNMTELEYLELKSKILQGQSKSDFNSISEHLQSYSDAAHVLPDKPTL